MNADSSGPGRDSGPAWSDEVAPCPQCGKDIPDFAIACPYCGSRFQVTRSGYCPHCRAVTGATKAGTCEKCGSEMMDVKTERRPTADDPAARLPAKFDVILKEGGDQPIKVIKVLRALTGLGLPEAMDLVEGAPNPVMLAVDRAEAEDIKKQLAEVGATVEIVAQAPAPSTLVSPMPEPSIASRPDEHSAAMPAVAARAAAPTTPDRAGVSTVTDSGEQGVVVSGVINAGRALLMLAPMGLVILWIVQFVARGHAATGGGSGAFLATRGNEAYMLGPIFFVLAIVTWILLGIGIKVRAGVNPIYRSKGFTVRRLILLALWVFGLLWYEIPFPRGSGVTVQAGGHIATILIMLALLGAVLMLGGRYGRRSSKTPTSSHKVPAAAAATRAETPDAAPQGWSLRAAIAAKPRSRRFWVLLGSGVGAVVVAAILVGVLVGGGSTEQQARSILDEADLAIRAAAAENLSWHYSAQQVVTMEGDAASGTLTSTMEGDVEPPQRARLSTELSATGDLTGNLPLMGRVTRANGDKGYSQEAVSVDGGNNFFVRVLQDDSSYSDWVETEEKAFVIFAEGWDLSEFVATFSEYLTDMEVAGSEEVDGVKCDIIEAKADIAKLLEARKDMLAGLQSFDVEMLAEYMKGTPPEVKIWIGTDDSLPYRITMKLTVSVSEGGMSQSIVMESMESVTRYGETVSPPIEAPRIR